MVHAQGGRRGRRVTPQCVSSMGCMESRTPIIVHSMPLSERRDAAWRAGQPGRIPEALEYLKALPQPQRTMRSNGSSRALGSTQAFGVMVHTTLLRGDTVCGG